MTDPDPLAALDEALRPYLELLRSPNDQNDKIIRGVAARLAAGRGDAGLIPHTCPYCGGLHSAKPFPDTGQNPTHRREDTDE